MSTQQKRIYTCDPPADLTPAQREFWDSFPSQLFPSGHARRCLALLNGWYTRYDSFEAFTGELYNEQFAAELLADETKLRAYAAALKLRGA